MNSNSTKAKTLMTCLAVLIVSGAHGSDDAKAILAKAVQACKALKSVKYTMEGRSFGGEKYKATVLQQRADVSAPGPMSGKYAIVGEFDKEPFAFSYDGKVFRYRLDNRAVETITSPTAAEISQALPMGVALSGIDMFSLPTMVFTKVKYLKQDTIGGRDCDLIETTRELEGKQGEHLVFLNRWAIDRKTSLPVFFDSDRGSVKTVTSIETNVVVSERSLKLEGKKGRMRPFVSGLAQRQNSTR
jgi:hypothetical protein